MVFSTYICIKESHSIDTNLLSNSEGSGQSDDHICFLKNLRFGNTKLKL